MTRTHEEELLVQEWKKLLFLSENIDMLRFALELETEGYKLKSPVYKKLLVNCYRLSVIDLASLRDYFNDTQKQSFFFQHLAKNLEIFQSIIEESTKAKTSSFTINNQTFNYQESGPQHRADSLKKYLGITSGSVPSPLTEAHLTRIKSIFLAPLNKVSQTNPNDFRNKEAHIFSCGWGDNIVRKSVQEIITQFDEVSQSFNELSSMMFASGYIIESVLDYSIKDRIKVLYEK